MTWNHRVFKKKVYGEYVYTIRETQYDENGKIISWTQDPIEPLGDSLEELREHYKDMGEALDRHVLEDHERTIENKTYFEDIEEEVKNGKLYTSEEVFGDDV